MCACLLTVGAVLSPLGTGVAAAVPTANFDWSPKPVVVGTPVTLTNTSTGVDTTVAPTYTWTLPGMLTCAAAPTCEVTPPQAGTWDVMLTVTDATGTDSVIKSVTVVPPNQLPPADFAALPSSPLPGDEVTFIALSDDPDGTTTDWAWDLNGDGAFDDGDTKIVTHRFATAGPKTVSLQVTDNDGATATQSLTLTVRQPGTPPPPAASSPVTTGGVTTVGNTISTAPLPKLMNPFPVVTMGGSVGPTGTEIELLAVRATRGSQVSVRCRGKDCRLKPLSRVVREGRLRLKRAERIMPAGVVLEVRVRRANRIGKFTRVKFRDEKRPKRTDGCLWPGTSRMAPCPRR